MNRKEEGGELYPKYNVSKVNSDEDVRGYFVLRLKDENARKAIKTYAEEVDNEILSKELERWIKEYEDLKCIDTSKGFCNKVESPVCCLHCIKKDECIMEGEIECYLVEMGEVGSIEGCKQYFDI